MFIKGLPINDHAFNNNTKNSFLLYSLQYVWHFLPFKFTFIKGITGFEEKCSACNDK